MSYMAKEGATMEGRFW